MQFALCSKYTTKGLQEFEGSTRRYEPIYLWIVISSVKCILTICNLVISYNGFEGRICVMIAAVPDHCLLFLIVQKIKELFVDLNNIDFPW